MASAGQHQQEFGRLAHIGRLAQDAAAQRDGGIGAEHDIIGLCLHRQNLLAGDARALGARLFADLCVFVKVGGAHRVGYHAEMRQKFQPPGAAGSENQRHGAGPVRYLKR